MILIKEETTLDDCLTQATLYQMKGYLQQFWYSASQVTSLGCGKNV